MEKARAQMHRSTDRSAKIQCQPETKKEQTIIDSQITLDDILPRKEAKTDSDKGDNGRHSPGGDDGTSTVRSVDFGSDLALGGVHDIESGRHDG